MNKILSNKNIFKISNKTLISLLFITLISLLIFFKIFSAGLYPVPGDLLVSFYFPWYSGGWDGYNPWTVHKELLNADAIRQIYIWKELAIDQFKHGQIPLWNPYTFSGQPLAANFQSSVFYPLNIIYFLINPKDAWIILVMIQPLLAGLFSYLFIRSLKLSRIASVYGSVVFIFSSYLITWLENGNIIHSYLWLPLIFFAVTKFFENNKFRYLITITLSLTLSILAGHPQTAIYIYMAFILFWLYKSSFKKKSSYLKSLSFAIILSLSLSSIQLITTANFYLQSPISLPFSKEVFDKFLIPYTNFVTFLAPDFFGHPATNNFWNFTYGDFTPYIGVIPFIFFILGLLIYKKNSFITFSYIAGGLFLLASVSSPISLLVKTFKIPILDSTSSARFMSITLFLMSVVSAFGLEHFLLNITDKKFQKKFFLILSFLGVIYLFLWTFTFFGPSLLSPNDLWQTRLKVSQRNLILPSALYIFLTAAFFLSLIIFRKIKLAKLQINKFLIFVIFFGTIFGGLYFSNKFLPVSPKKYIFPQHPIFDYLSQNVGIDRFYSFGTAHIDFNFPAAYRVYSIEGYDTLRYQRYAQLLASSFFGYVPKTYLRSDAVLPTEENGYRKRLLDIMGVHYLLDKEDNPRSDSDWHYERFPGDNVEGVWQSGKFQIYKRKDALPRIFLSTGYEILKKDQDIINKLYDPNYNLEKIIIEKEPEIIISNNIVSTYIPQIEKYTPNEVIIKSSAPQNSLLFLSDAYDKDWKVYINGRKSELLRADYAFRAVAVPSGVNIIRFSYDPASFKIGLSLSLISVLIIIISVFYKKRTSGL